MWMLKLATLWLLGGLYFVLGVCQEPGDEGTSHWQGALPRITFSREALMRLRPLGRGFALKPPSIPEELRGLVIKTRRRKRGRRGGIHRRLKRMSLQDRRRLPALPSILLGNAQSIRNKLDELDAWITTRQEIKNTCLLVFTESWLSESDREEDLMLPGFGAPLRLDRDKGVTDKQRGGGVCCYVNKSLHPATPARSRCSCLGEDPEEPTTCRSWHDSEADLPHAEDDEAGQDQRSCSSCQEAIFCVSYSGVARSKVGEEMPLLLSEAQTQR
uniref:Uncharacterized protein n=1 Tax=Nothobranchius kadleci TaxID=1051664 RepID=A0A1A8DL22_NOTKA